MTHPELQEILTYSPETGDFKWRKRKTKATPGYINRNGYRVIMLGYKNYLAHRLAWLYVHGAFPPEQLDHINHVRSDNRITNLRAVSNQENQKNRGYTGNSSGRIGVCFDKARNKWKPHIKVDQKLINLGRFDTLEEAVAVRVAAERQHGFHVNHGILTGLLQ